VKPPEQTEIQSSVEHEGTYLAKIWLREIGLFLLLPVAILMIVLSIIPFPISLLIFYSSAILLGVIMIIFAAPYGRHLYRLALRTNKEVSRKTSKMLGVEVEERFLNIFFLSTFLGPTFEIWWLRILGVAIIAFFAHELYIFLS
jgi:hypothetical protein